MSYERRRDYKINDPSLMIVGCRFLEILFSKIFSRISFRTIISKIKVKISEFSRFSNPMSYERDPVKKGDERLQMIRPFLLLKTILLLIFFLPEFSSSTLSKNKILQKVHLLFFSFTHHLKEENLNWSMIQLAWWSEIYFLRPLWSKNL